jgi:hypothetical protein
MAAADRERSSGRAICSEQADSPGRSMRGGRLPLAGEPAVAGVLAQKDTAKHPFA